MNKKILTFAHIPKTAGTTFAFLLQRHFGLRHLAVSARKDPRFYERDSLRFDLRITPGAASIAGHCLRPFLDFGPLEDKLVWYTFLRDPYKRFVSHYQHALEKSGFQGDIHQWAAQLTRDNWMTRNLAGSANLDAAVEILEKKISFLGFTEDFDASLLMLIQHFDLAGFDPCCKPLNRARNNSLAGDILADKQKYGALLAEQNALDVQLYQYAREQIWPRQVKAFGGEALLAEAVAAFQQRVYRASLAGAANRLGYRLFRHLFYRPLVYAHRYYIS